MKTETVKMPWGLINCRWKKSWVNPFGRVIKYEYKWNGKWIEGKNWNTKSRLSLKEKVTA